MRLHRAGGARLLPAAYGIPWVPEIPRQWRRGTEPGVTAVTNVFGIPDDPAAGTQRRAAPPPAPANSGGPAAGPQPRGARPPNPSGHEQVVFCHDAPTGLRAIIAIYSTALGPALGGTRFYAYPSEDAALADVLNLSRAMAYKNALAGLDHGGGKAVIIGDPARLKSEALLRAY